MGARRQIIFKYANDYNANSVCSDIYLYSHWGGYSLHEELADALEHARPRWGDEPYFTRMVICHLLRNDVLGEVNWGIAPYYMDSEYQDLAVDIKNKTVNGLPFQEFIDQQRTERSV